MASTKMDAMKTNATEDAVSRYAIGINESGELMGTCAGGTMECLGLLLATARVCDVYDEVLRDATLLINRILTDVGNQRKDQSLMLCNVGGEILLCWGRRELPKSFTPIEDIKQLRQVLGVEPSRTTDGEEW